jgi:hypothetical protein
MFVDVCCIYITWPLVPSSLGHPSTVPGVPGGPGANRHGVHVSKLAKDQARLKASGQCPWLNLLWRFCSAMMWAMIMYDIYIWDYMSWYDIYIYIHIQCVYVYIYIIYYYEIIYELFFVIWEYLNYDGDWGYEETQHLLANWPGRHQWAVVKKNHPSGLGRPLFAHSFTGGLLWG